MKRSSKASIKTLKIDGIDVAAREHETILPLAQGKNRRPRLQ